MPSVNAVRVLLFVYDDLPLSPNGDLCNVGIRGWATGQHQHIGERKVRWCIVIARTGNASKDPHSHERGRLHDRITQVLANVSSEPGRELRTKDSVERKVCHLWQLQPLSRPHDQCVGEAARALDLNRYPIALMKVTVIEPIVDEPASLLSPFASAALTCDSSSARVSKL